MSLDCVQLADIDEKERRDARLRRPENSNGSVLYRSDGVTKRLGARPMPAAGWGTARWSSDGALAEVAHGRLEQGATENIEKYK